MSSEFLPSIEIKLYNSVNSMIVVMALSLLKKDSWNCRHRDTSLTPPVASVLLDVRLPQPFHVDKAGTLQELNA